MAAAEVKEAVREMVASLCPAAVNQFDALYVVEADRLQTYCNLPEIAQSHAPVLTELVIWRAGRIGSEAISSEGYSGVSYQYSDDLPAPIKKRMNSIRRVKW